jgi:hypothetical protein
VADDGDIEDKVVAVGDGEERVADAGFGIEETVAAAIDDDGEE